MAFTIHSLNTATSAKTAKGENPPAAGPHLYERDATPTEYQSPKKSINNDISYFKQKWTCAVHLQWFVWTKATSSSDVILPKTGCGVKHSSSKTEISNVKLWVFQKYK